MTHSDGSCLGGNPFVMHACFVEIIVACKRSCFLFRAVVASECASEVM